MKRFFRKIIKETWYIDYNFVIPFGILVLLMKGFIDYVTKGYLIWHYYEWTFINEIFGGTAFFLILSKLIEMIIMAKEQVYVPLNSDLKRRLDYSAHRLGIYASNLVCELLSQQLMEGEVTI